MKLKDLVNISYGPQGSDCTGSYYITPKKSFTVRDFVNAVIADTREWGYIGIAAPRATFGNPNIEYKWGELITANFPDEILNKQVLELSGSGGWSRSDYILKI